MKKQEILYLIFEKVNIKFTERQIEQFIRYYELLVEKNKVMNLTAITEFNEVVTKHFMDSLAIKRVYNMNQAGKMIDMGTGAGFPGIPLKIAFPDMEIVLLDSLNKRVKFLNEVINELSLKNIIAVHGRAEDYGRVESYRENFDLCVSRAVARLAVLSEYCMPYVKVNGYFIPYKAGNIEAELKESKKAVGILGGSIEKIDRYKLPGTDIERTLIKIKKVNHTSKLYPRGLGKPSKEPLM